MIDIVPPALPPVSRPGPAVLALGFRPFYLLAAVLAMPGVGLWVLNWRGWLAPLDAMPPSYWHSHEMVFGFAGAVIAGFLFTAARNWTGLPTPSGWKLAGLCLLWSAGRAAPFLNAGGIAALPDLAFLPVVALALWGPLQRTRNRNRVLVAVLVALAAADAAFHLALAGVLEADPLSGVRAGLYGVVLLVTVMGGRVIPSFTANAIPGAAVRSRKSVDVASIAAAALACASILAFPQSAFTGLVCIAAGVLHAIRLYGWAPVATVRTPILWILHAAYAWIPLAFWLHGACALGVPVATSLADHALAVGAVGGIIVGMITRTARGHTGRPLQAGRVEVGAYVLVQAAAVLRVLVPAMVPGATGGAVTAAGLLWVCTFALYLTVFSPWLTRPRVDGKPG